MDLPAIGVDGEAHADSGHPVEERAPGRDVEELGDEVAPGGEPGPVEVGHPVAAVPAACDRGDRREGAVRPGEICRIDDETVGEGEECLEVRGLEGRRAGPPQEDRQIGEQQRDHRARQPGVGIPVRADEHLLVRDLLRRRASGKAAVQPELADPGRAGAVGEDHDRSGGMTDRQVRDRSRRPTGVRLAGREDDEVEDRCPRDRMPQLAGVRRARSPQARELVLDPADAADRRSPDRFVDRERHARAQGFRHARPSRPMRRSASVGPQVPPA